MKRALAAAVAVTAVFAPAAGAAQLKVRVLSDRPDVISGGNALVAVKIPHGIHGVTVKAGASDVTKRFRRRANHRFEGLLTHLRVGTTRVTASAPGVTAGPFQYENTAGLLETYDPASPPSDVAMTKTDNGKTVPFIIRTETGYMDRDQYAISVLYDPKAKWKPWKPQPQFDHKLLITHGASCGIDHQAGTAPSTTTDTVGVPGLPVNPSSSPTTALGMGYAVMSTALDNSGHNCNLVTQAESLVMAKEHLVERYGELRFTIGTGCSGGSLAQQQIANAYPGVYQGILPQCSFPDAWSTGSQLVDYHLTRNYFQNPGEWGLGIVWDPASIAAVQGHPNYANSIILDSLYFTALGDPTNACAGVTDAQRWSPSNPKGVRCTLADDEINILGARASDGYAGRPLDNVGVQYGLDAAKSGSISVAQFVDINEKIGGADINAVPTAARVAADEPALLNANRSGGINDGSNLDQVAIIDLRGSDDGSFHDAYRAFSVRARLDREHGTHANQVIWEGPVPLLGGTDFTTKGLLAMDRWLTAVSKDSRKVNVATKIREDKPKDIVDHCELPGGVSQPGLDCPAEVRVYKTPRIVAGDSIATDTNKCQLKRLAADDDGIKLSDDQLAGLKKAFPDGVCDYSKPAVDSATPTLPWMQYDVSGGKPLRGRRVATGWAGPAFRSIRGPAAARRQARAALKRRR